MIENSPQYISDCLNTDYGIANPTLIYLPLGADTDAEVFKATADDRSYFVKVKRGHQYDVSVALISLLREAGIHQVISPVPTVDGELTCDLKEYTITVYPFVDAKDGFCSELIEDQWVTLGKVLKQIHEFKVPPSIRARIRKENYTPKWRRIVPSLNELIAGPLSGDEIALKLQAFMKEHREEITRLVDRAEALSEKAQKLAPEFVLCHSDIHGGNVLIDENGDIFIVDWDEPIWAPKERDLMFIGGGVNNTWNDPHEEEAFYRGYGETKVNKIILAYYRHERIVEDIAILGQALLQSTKGGENRREMYQQFTDLFEPNGVVDIAFRTDDELS